MAKVRNCDACGKEYEYQRPSSKYCSQGCRYNANNRVNGRVRIPDNVRFSILQRDGFACRYCGRRPPHTELQVDHVVPVSQGGAPLSEDNLISTCARCNNGHGSIEVDPPDPVIGIYWNTKDFPPEEWIEVSAIRIVTDDDGVTYELEVM